jgi:hypothetical protein
MFWGISDCSSDDARDHDARQNLLHSHRRASHQLDVVEVLTFRLPSEAPHFLRTSRSHARRRLFRLAFVAGFLLLGRSAIEP